MLHELGATLLFIEKFVGCHTALYRQLHIEALLKLIASYCRVGASLETTRPYLMIMPKSRQATTVMLLDVRRSQASELLARGLHLFNAEYGASTTG